MKHTPMIPRIVFSELGRRWYCVTKYTIRQGINTTTGEPVEYLRASIKHDITEQMELIIDADRSRQTTRAPWRKRDGTNRRQSGGRRTEPRRGRDDKDGRRQG